MLKSTSILLKVLGTFATLSSAKFDYGPCPWPITKFPFNQSLTGTYYLQYYDKMLDDLMPIVKIMFKFEDLDCLSKPLTHNNTAYDLDKRPLK